MRLEHERSRSLEQRPLAIDVHTERQLGDADQPPHDFYARILRHKVNIADAASLSRRHGREQPGSRSRDYQMRREHTAIELGVAEKAELRIDHAHAVRVASTSCRENSHRGPASRRRRDSGGRARRPRPVRDRSAASSRAAAPRPGVMPSRSRPFPPRNGKHEHMLVIQRAHRAIGEDAAAGGGNVDRGEPRQPVEQGRERRRWHRRAAVD